MKLSHFFPTSEQLKLIQGVEGELLKRKRLGKLGGIAAFAGALLQLLIIVWDKQIPIESIIDFFRDFIFLRWGELFSYEFSGMLLLFAGAGSYLLLKWTGFLIKESEEPFRYTFWIEPFEAVKETPGARFTIKEDDRFHLLHHDLMERLNERIRRLSLLEEASKEDSTPQGGLTSHIHIDGHYAIREEKDKEWVIHVMPRIRIGPPGRAATLATPVKYRLDEKEKEYVLNADKYNQIVERVYFNIATQVYRQIESDVKGKIALFPTPYLRAVALFHEAEDFARSNTIDAYDLAIDLYKEALRYFNIAEMKWISKCLLKCRLLWRTEVKFQHIKAMVQIGYAKCLIYKRVLSALSGRYMNPLFEIRNELHEVRNKLFLLHNRMNKKWPIEFSKKDKTGFHKEEDIKEKNRLNTLMALLTFPKDSWRKYFTLSPKQYLFEKQTCLLFDAYLVSALTHYYLDAAAKAKDYLADAKDVAPAMSERNALYLFASGVIEPDPDQAISLLRQATEIAPDFQIAQYLLAYWIEVKFRAQNEIIKQRTESVMKGYDKVLELNPGNIAALSAQGYLWWLLGNSEEARKKFDQGSEIKAVASEIYIGELQYGLARIAAEEDDFNTSYDLYTQALSADPGVGAYSITASRRATTAAYYGYIDSAMLKRYKRFKEKVEKNIKGLERSVEDREGKVLKKTLNAIYCPLPLVLLQEEEKGKVSKKTLDAVYSFVLNDYGNACLNYFHRFGNMYQLKNAINVYKEAIEKYPQNRVAHYNLHNAYMNAYMWRGKKGDMKERIGYLEKAERLGPTWPVAVIALAQSRLRQGQDEIRKMMEEATKQINMENEARDELEKREKLLARGREEEKIIVSQGGAKGQMSVSTRVGKDQQSEDVKVLELKLSETHKKVQTHGKKAKELYEEAKKLSGKNVKDVLPEIKTIIERNKLSSMYELKFDINGEGLDMLLSEEIGKDRLDKNDVEALRVWAGLLANNYQSENDKAQGAAKKLCQYIQDEYYPDNFDVNLILFKLPICFAHVKC
ncbi:MAG: hypothetical protein A3G93_07605 [Nitrospinae bacterium RIFCSPLOWO2_12_FULL_45_22]|nr:MAG: hypothetical protein A3G93_07605 [Nitrospinae bacterium RIFCSPLOWO2_12_FULL_45_22]